MALGFDRFAPGLSSFNQSGEMAKPLAGRKSERLRIEDKLVVIEESSKIRGADFVVIGVIKNKSDSRLSGVKIVATFNDKRRYDC